MSQKKLPLEREDFDETDPATGTAIRRTVYQRGLLRSEAVNYEDESVGLLALSNGVQKNFEDLRVRARAVLRDAQLPTDEDGGELRLPERLARHGKITAEAFVAGFGFKSWSRIVEEKSEPLSRERSAMLLITAINAILKKTSDQDALRSIWFLMQANHDFEMLALGINEAAVSAQRAEKGRAKGPPAQAAKGARKKAIIRELAEAYWKRMPVHRRNLDQTVLAIISELEARLEAEKLSMIGRSQLLTYLREIRHSAGG
jgi:hypothetical protein